MAQFDVYKNPSKASRNSYPFILDIQNDLLDDIATRIVIPLVDYGKRQNQALKGLTPKVNFEDKELLILTPQIASMPARLLKDPVGTLDHLRDEIVAALDTAISGI